MNSGFFFSHLPLLEHFLRACLLQEWGLLSWPTCDDKGLAWFWKVLPSCDQIVTLKKPISCTFTAEWSSKWPLSEVKIYQKFCGVFEYNHVTAGVWPALVALTVVFPVTFVVAWTEGPDETVWLDVKVVVTFWAGVLGDISSVRLSVCAGTEGVGGAWEVNETLSGGTAEAFCCVDVDAWMDVPVDKLAWFVDVTRTAVEVPEGSASKEGAAKEKKRITNEWIKIRKDYVGIRDLSGQQYCSW